MRMKAVKCWLTILGFVLLTPVLSSAHETHKGCDPYDYYHHKCNKVTAEEGGSAAAYLLGVGVTCLGGVLISSRLRRLNRLP